MADELDTIPDLTDGPANEMPLRRLDPYTTAEIDARVLRQRAVLARIRDLGTTAIDIMTARLQQSLLEGQGREDLIAALWLVAHKDDIYDALAQQRQAEVLSTGQEIVSCGSHFIEGLVRIGFVPPAMVAAVESIMEAAIAMGESDGCSYEFFLVWAGACRHRWLWEIVHAAHRRSLMSRRAL